MAGLDPATQHSRGGRPSGCLPCPQFFVPARWTFVHPLFRERVVVK
jgi:hypothetical protein